MDRVKRSNEVHAPCALADLDRMNSKQLGGFAAPLLQAALNGTLDERSIGSLHLIGHVLRSLELRAA